MITITYIDNSKNTFKFFTMYDDFLDFFNAHNSFNCTQLYIDRIEKNAHNIFYIFKGNISHNIFATVMHNLYDIYVYMREVRKIREKILSLYENKEILIKSKNIDQKNKDAFSTSIEILKLHSYILSISLDRENIFKNEN